MESRKKSHRSPSLLCCIFVLCVQPQLALTGDCPADGRTWVPFEDRCYHFVHGNEDKIKSYNFDSAKILCQHFELLTIQSEAENTFVIDYGQQVWKGSVEVIAWLGMYYDTNRRHPLMPPRTSLSPSLLLQLTPDSDFSCYDNMTWLQDSPVKFSNWEDSSFPSDLAPMDTCAALHTKTGKWEVVSCNNDVENGVICEAAQDEGKAKRKPSAVLSALVILSVVAIVGVSAVVWFLHQKHNFGSSVVTAFEYHPPFRVPDTDQSCLVEAEETDSVP